MICNENKVKAKDGTNIFIRCWQPEGIIKAVVCLVHGYGEHSNRYITVAEALTSENVALIAFDLRGHGLSSGKRGHTPTYEHLMMDITMILDEAKTLYKNIPIFLYGHSMGGNLVLNYVLRNNPCLTGVIVTSPWLGLASPPSKPLLFLVKIMSKIYPSFGIKNKMDITHLSHDIKNNSDYKNDPLVHNFITTRLFTSIQSSGIWAIANSSNFNKDLLLMQGSEDHITSLNATKDFASKIRSGITFKIWEGMYHEIHNELDKKYVLDYMVSWIKERL
ncbi:MAG TPA: lysophospholipase [Clostridiaceae bacterium]